MSSYLYDKSGVARCLLLAEGKRRSLPAHNKHDEPDQLSGYCLSQLPDRCSGIILNIHYKIEYYPSICQPAFGWLFFGRHRPDFSFFSRSLNLPRFCAKRALNVSRLCGSNSATRASRCACLRILTAKYCVIIIWPQICSALPAHLAARAEQSSTKKYRYFNA